jgi:hypothetical protein
MRSCGHAAGYGAHGRLLPQPSRRPLRRSPKLIEGYACRIQPRVMLCSAQRRCATSALFSEQRRERSRCGIVRRVPPAQVPARRLWSAATECTCRAQRAAPCSHSKAEVAAAWGACARPAAPVGRFRVIDAARVDQTRPVCATAKRATLHWHKGAVERRILIRLLIGSVSSFMRPQDGLCSTALGARCGTSHTVRGARRAGLVRSPRAQRA